jgi:proline dehydrogenase
MKDDLTNKITGSLTADGGFPLVVKVRCLCRLLARPDETNCAFSQSMSYGDLKECLPFLARRATENKAVLEGRGGAAAERVRLGREIRRRLLPFQ